MARSVLLSVCAALLCTAVIQHPAMGAMGNVGPVTAAIQSAHALVRLEAGVPRSRALALASEIDGLYSRVGHDLGDTPPRLEVKLYATHASFTKALWAEQHARPESSTDDTSSVVNGTLLLGPLPDAYLHHNLAHVYTEWIIDRLTGNRSGELPPLTWLYDGLAEYEAFKYAPAGMRCNLNAPPPIDITIVRTAQQWMSIRAGPLGSLEYCLAYIETRGLVARVGWASVVRALHQRSGWMAVAQRLLAMKHPAAP